MAAFISAEQYPGVVTVVVIELAVVTGGVVVVMAGFVVVVDWPLPAALDEVVGANEVVVGDTASVVVVTTAAVGVEVVVVAPLPRTTPTGR